MHHVVNLGKQIIPWRLVYEVHTDQHENTGYGCQQDLYPPASQRKPWIIKQTLLYADRSSEVSSTLSQYTAGLALRITDW